MINRTIVALAVLAVAAGNAPSVRAQSAMSYSPATQKVTLSGESLTGIENRTLSEDYPLFSEPSEPAELNNLETDETFGSEFQRSVPLSDEVEVVGSQPNEASPSRPFLEPRARDDSEVEVRVLLNQ